MSLGEAGHLIVHLILLGGGVGEMIDDPMELPSYDFVLNGDIRKLYVPLIAELIRTADWHLC